jgi:hypothetical protein
MREWSMVRPRRGVGAEDVAVVVVTAMALATSVRVHRTPETVGGAAASRPSTQLAGLRSPGSCLAPTAPLVATCLQYRQTAAPQTVVAVARQEGADVAAATMAGTRRL